MTGTTFTTATWQHALHGITVFIMVKVAQQGAWRQQQQPWHDTIGGDDKHATKLCTLHVHLCDHYHNSNLG